MHLNICSILPKMDLVDIWVNDTNPDVFVFSETWLNNSIEDDSIRNNNVFRCGRPKKGGGVATYIKNNPHATKSLSVSVPKQFELLVTKIELSPNVSLYAVAVYCLTSAAANVMNAIAELLAPFLSSEVVYFRRS